VTTQIQSAAPKVLHLQSAAELEEVLRTADERGTPVTTSHSHSKHAVRLDLSALNAIEKYEPGDLTIRLQAGARVRNVLTVLAQHRLMLPFDMPGWENATIGGVLASAAHGPMRASFGGVREYCIGIEFAIAGGTLARAGGTVVKNVAGYDLMKLLIGSRGTLGIITSASFKVFPIPQRTATFIAQFDTGAEAIAFALRVRRSALSPLKLEIASPGLNAQVPRWTILVTAAGSEAILGRYRTALGALATGLLEFVEDEEAAIWKALHDACFTAGVLVDVSATLATTPSALHAMEETARSLAAHLRVFGRVGIGNLIGTFLLPADVHAEQMIADLHKRIPADASVQLVRPYSPLDHRGNLGMQIVKRTLDPKSILNPGAITL
jgi:FAD/FMN-containing dehydrogenase